MLAFIGFLNGLLGWCGTLVGIQGLTVEFVLGKVFMPLAWVLGTPVEVRTADLTKKRYDINERLTMI